MDQTLLNAWEKDEGVSVGGGEGSQASARGQTLNLATNQSTGHSASKQTRYHKPGLLNQVLLMVAEIWLLAAHMDNSITC